MLPNDKTSSRYLPEVSRITSSSKKKRNNALILSFFELSNATDHNFWASKLTLKKLLRKCCRRSEDTGRKVSFSTWNRREIVPWWRLGGSKSWESSLFLVIKKKIWLNNELQTTPLLGVLTYFLGYEPPLLLSLYVFMLTSKIFK